MKLVDILARELNVWPEGVARIMQTFAGMTFYQDAEGQTVPLIRISLADDWRLDKGVTREQWQTAVNANKPNINCRTTIMTKPQLPPGVIPIGATHFHHNPVIEKPTSNPWRKRSGAGWLAFYDGEWRGCNGSKAHLFVAIEDVIGAESPSLYVQTIGREYRLPAIGTHVFIHDPEETLVYGCGESGEVVAHVENTAVVRMSYGLGCFEASKLRTAEQIAAEERKKAIEEMVYGACGCEPDGGNTTAFMICGYIYDAGYRNKVQK